MDRDNILFRNLDATARLIKSVDLRGKTIVNTSTCTGYNMLGDMGIHRFKCELAVDGETFYEVETSFGWFLPEVFEKQTGLDGGAKVPAWHEAQGLSLAMGPVGTAVDGQRLHRRGARTQFLDKAAAIADGGKHSQGYGYGFKQVNKRDWFFSCHFWCDPVMPGSLGIESMFQLIELLCLEKGLHRGFGSQKIRFDHDAGETKWKYRGQLTRKNDTMASEVHIQSVERLDNAVVVIAEGTLYVDGLRVYEASGLRVRLVPDAESTEAEALLPAPAEVVPVVKTRVQYKSPTQPGVANDVSLSTSSPAAIASPRNVSVDDLTDLCAALHDVEAPLALGEAVVPAVAGKDLGNQCFMEHFGTKVPVMTGAMAKGVASADLVIAAGRAGILGSFGAGGLPLDHVESGIERIKAALSQGEPFAVNLIHSPANDTLEKGCVDILLRHGVRCVEASAFMKLTPHLNGHL